MCISVPVPPPVKVTARPSSKPVPVPGTYVPRSDTAKTLDKNQNQFVDWCLKNNWLYRDDASRLKAYQHRINQGFMAQKSVIYKGQDGAERVTMQPMFTPKGITHLANKFKKAVA